MTQRVIKGVLAGLIILGSMQAYANDTVSITLNGVSSMSSPLRDGQVISHGQISTQMAHRGYHVWLNAERNGDAPNRYILTGRSNQQNKIYVIIGQDGWVPDSKSGVGIIKQTQEAQAQFDIVMNGTQDAPADSYVIIAQGRYLEP
ncbi:AfaD family invasin [Edwardsiella tarda]